MAKKIHRFITDYKKTNNTIEIQDLEIIHQIKEVIKLRINEECIITKDDNIENICIIKEFQKNKILLDIVKSEINELEPDKKVHLYLSILKKENFELVLQKASEMGIFEITPVITERTVKTNLNFKRLHKITREASEISGRSQITKINDIIGFSDAIKNNTANTKILFDVTGHDVTNQEIVLNKEISIYIGPEGGFTENEILLAKENNIEIKNLGKLTLRGETAGIIACYLAMQINL